MYNYKSYVFHYVVMHIELLLNSNAFLHMLFCHIYVTTEAAALCLQVV